MFWTFLTKTKSKAGPKTDWVKKTESSCVYFSLCKRGGPMLYDTVRMEGLLSP